MSRRILIFLAYVQCSFFWMELGFAKNFLGNWQFECQDPTAVSRDHQGRIYSFESVIICDISGNRGEIENIGPRFLHWLESNPDFDIKKKIELDHEMDETAYQLELLEKRDSGHGVMRILSDSMLLSKDSKFLFSNVSRSIKASDRAKYTVSENFEVALTKKRIDAFELKVRKFVKIKKPSLAPRSLFFSEVKKGMKKDIDTTSYKYARLLSSYL